MEQTGHHAGVTTARQSAWQDDGFLLFADAVSPEDCQVAIAALESTSREGPGDRRLLEQSWCRGIAETLRSDGRFREALPAGHVATLCTFFSKSTSTNWLVPLHQDLSIAVAERIDDASLGGWSEKDGVLHVQPPFAFLETLVAVRVHLDDCGADDGPLHVVPGSHRSGRLAPADATRLRNAQGTQACVARRGDVLIMRPLLLHASSKATGSNRRRVLHYVFGPHELPHGLRWHMAL